MAAGLIALPAYVDLERLEGRPFQLSAMRHEFLLKRVQSPTSPGTAFLDPRL
jgi:hypothetical protein